MKTAISKYFLYIIVYGYIFLLFLKGYYPANETGILFIGFMIFMILAYTFAGSLISDELNARRAEIYHKFESLLDQQYQTLKLLRTVHQNIAKYKQESRISIKNFNLNIESEISKKTDQGVLELFNYETTHTLANLLREQYSITKEYTQIAYILAAKQLVKNRLKLKG